ncbi:MAG: DsrE family protein [Chloroflexi bacterium]|nr:DsrE family protein [Chloroflexota bacterium]
MAGNEKLTFMVTRGPDEPELASIPFVMAVAALASDVEVVVGLQGSGVELAVRGRTDRVEARGFPPLSKLLDDYRDLGGRLLVCTPCIRAREIDERQFVENAELVAAGRFVAEVTSATNALVY